MSTGKNLVPKPKSESEACTGGGDRETQNGAVFSPPPPFIPPPRAAAVFPPAPPYGGRATVAPHGPAATSSSHGPTTCVRRITVTKHTNYHPTVIQKDVINCDFKFKLGTIERWAVEKSSAYLKKEYLSADATVAVVSAVSFKNV